MMNREQHLDYRIERYSISSPASRRSGFGG